jgi:hypothetical protein
MVRVFEGYMPEQTRPYQPVVVLGSSGFAVGDL